MKRAVILGCSHASGSEMEKEFGSDDIVYGYTHSYPALIAQSLGYQILNHSIPGGSNDAMFRIWNELSDQLTSNDLVIACWTGFNRTEIYYPKQHRWLPMAPGSVFVSVESHRTILQGKPINIESIPECEKYQQQWVTYGTSEEFGRLNKIKNVLALNTSAQHLKIPVINIESFSGVDGYCYPSWINRPVGDVEFCNWCVDRGFSSTSWGHFFSNAHRAFADFVLTNLVD